MTWLRRGCNVLFQTTSSAEDDDDDVVVVRIGSNVDFPGNSEVWTNLVEAEEAKDEP